MYINNVDKIYQYITDLNELRDVENKKITINIIKEKYRLIKESLTADIKKFEKYEAVGIASSFYEPALRDMLHNSTLLAINQVALKNIDKLQNSIYDIKDYAIY